MKKSKSIFTIRRKRNERHPQIIIDANKISFKSMSLTHSKKSGNRNNIALIKNPNRNDKRKAYVSKRIIENFKFLYSKAFQNYVLSNEDIEELIKFLESKKK